MKPMWITVATALLGVGTLAGCAHPAAPPPSAALRGSPTASGPAAVARHPTDPRCTGGLTGTEPGVARITCDGTATIRVRAGGAEKSFHGGVCRSAGDIWSAAAGVVIDTTGTHGKYTGPPVDSVAVNNTDRPGRGTIQVVLRGKHYDDLGEATMRLTGGGKRAHLQGTSERLSDVPGAGITVDVTC